MSTISALSSQIASATSLSSLLNNKSSDSNSSDKSTSLTSLLNDDSNSSGSSDDSADTLYNLLVANSGFRDYSLLKDSSGNVFIPTIDQMNNATTVDSKLTLASGVAQSVLIQADACSKTGIAMRASDITDQAKSVMDAIADAISAVTNGTAADNDTTRNTLSSYQSTISETLNSLNTALSEMTNLLSKVPESKQTALVSTLTEIDALGATIARESGASWTSITGNGDNTVSGYSAATGSTTSYSGTSSLLNLLA